MKHLQIFIFTLSIIMLVGIFAPMYTITAIMDMPSLFGENTQVSKTMSSSLFQLIIIISQDLKFQELATFSFTILSVIIPLLIVMIAFIEKYEWLFTLATVYLISCISLLYVYIQKFEDDMFQIQFGWAWACFLIPGFLVLMIGTYKLMKKEAK